MRTISATIVVFSGAICIAAGALSDNSVRGCWAIASGLVLAAIGVYDWLMLIGWITTSWGPPQEP